MEYIITIERFFYADSNTFYNGETALVDEGHGLKVFDDIKEARKEVERLDNEPYTLSKGESSRPVYHARLKDSSRSEAAIRRTAIF